MVALTLSGMGLPEAVSPSPRSVDTASMPFGFRRIGSALFGSPGSQCIENGCAMSNAPAYKNIASIAPGGLMEVGAGLRRPVDIFPGIDIPVGF